MSHLLQKHIVVVGAGLAGLAAGYRLKKRGYRVTVLEAGNYPGGRAASIRKDGYLIDNGATGVGGCYTEYLELLDEIGQSDKLVKASTITGTLRDGHIHELDASRALISGIRSKLFSWRSKLTLPRVYKDLKSMGDKLCFEDVSKGHEWDDESAHAYSMRRLNQELYDYFVDPILRALVVGRGTSVSKLELLNSLDGLMGTEILATRGGLEVLPRGLAAELDMHYDCRVTRVTEGVESVDVVYNDTSGGEVSIKADGCVVATLLPQAVDIYPECLRLVKPLSDELHYVPGICVHLGYKKRTNSKALMVLLPTVEEPDITLIWLDHNKVDDRAPEGHSLFYFWFDDAVAGQAGAKSNEQLVKQCSQLVEKLFPEVSGEQDMSNVFRWESAVPLPATGIYKRMHQVRLNLDNHHGRVQLAGDYLSCVGQNTAVHYGNEAASKLDRVLSDSATDDQQVKKIVNA